MVQFGLTIYRETLASHLADPKNSPFAEAMNVPFLIRYPGKLKPGISDLLLGTPDIMPTLLSLAGLKEAIPLSVQGLDLSENLMHPDQGRGPAAQLYIQNTDGMKDAAGKVRSYFPVSRGIKTQRYTLSISINKNKEIVKVLLFDDLKDPYQMQNLQKDNRIFKSLCKQMANLLKQADDPWYREKILSEIIPYD